MATVTVSPDFLRRLGSPEHVVRTDTPLFSRFMTRFEIDTPARAAHFFAQVCGETGAGSRFAEGGTNANVSTGIGGRGWVQLTADYNYRCYHTYLQREDRPDRESAPERDVFRNRTLLLQPLYRVHAACWYWYTGYLCHPDGSTGPRRGNGNYYADRGGFSQVAVITDEVVRPGELHLRTRQDYYRRAAVLIDEGLILFDGERAAAGWGQDGVLVASAGIVKHGALAKPGVAAGLADAPAPVRIGAGLAALAAVGFFALTSR